MAGHVTCSMLAARRAWYRPTCRLQVTMGERMSAIEEIQSAVRTSPSASGRRSPGSAAAGDADRASSWRPGIVLTNAHVLRGEEVAVPLGGGEAAHGRVAGVDPDLDLAVIAVDTGDIEPRHLGARGGRGGSASARRSFALADPGGRGLRATVGFVSSAGRAFRGPRGRRIARLDRAHRAAAARLVGRPARRRRRPAARPQHRAPGGRADPRPAGRRRPARAASTPSPRGEAAQRPRLGVALAPPRAARRMRAAVGLPERDGLLVRAVQDGLARPTRPASPAATCSSPSTAAARLRRRPLRRARDRRGRADAHRRARHRRARVEVALG